jgi:hypothetical protein
MIMKSLYSAAVPICIAATVLFSPSPAQAQNSSWRIHEFATFCETSFNPIMTTCGSSVLVYNSQSGKIYRCEGVNENTYNPNSVPVATCHTLTSPVNGPIDAAGATAFSAGPEQKLVNQFNPSDKTYYTANVSYYWVVSNETALNLYFCSPILSTSDAKCVKANLLSLDPSSDRLLRPFSPPTDPSR